MNIAYGICGEGRGHASRSLTLIEELSKQHNINIFAGDEAYDFMRLSNLNANYIPSLRFKFKNNGAISLFKTIPNVFQFIKNARKEINKLCDIFQKTKIDLVITDFEPLVIRAAHKLHLPVISVDNQHKFTRWPKSVPLSLKIYSIAAGLFTRSLITTPRHVIVTTFHVDDYEETRFLQTNVMIRQTMAQMSPTNDDHVVVYIKPQLLDQILPVLVNVHETVFYVFGVGERKNYGNIIFKNTSSVEFAQMLASCAGVIGCAGNQLIGEACYFGKKFLALPIEGQGEQLFNAWHVHNSKIGQMCKINNLTPDKVRCFLETNYRKHIKPNGVNVVTKEINKIIRASLNCNQ